ncbi:MAG: AbrB/MazE/SpoVT family DNA-binding domain-containing protein [Thermoleophilia bacterium]|nr:AbrB/MazE/SpoVT family DNA-binding domain-containing protein [Thermoleophilia bacterium]MDH5334497.1 AbrB/MazE/SpoVT family DNA-binding domain-containing protein [Thermoleophilia bacterium]
MKTTIDKAGRIVIPKPMRDELGLRGGTEVEVELVDGHIEIEATAARMWLERNDDGFLVARTDRELPRLTAERVRALLEQIRR